MQLHNLKLQQALVGLNVRQAAAAGDTAALGGKFRDLRGRKEVNYTQQDAKEIIDRNTADDNAAYMRLAERLIQQQDAAVSSPAGIPRQYSRARPRAHFQARRGGGSMGGFEDWAESRDAADAAPWGIRILFLGVTLVVLGLIAWAGRALFGCGPRVRRRGNLRESKKAGVRKFGAPLYRSPGRVNSAIQQIKYRARFWTAALPR